MLTESELDAIEELLFDFKIEKDAKAKADAELQELDAFLETLQNNPF